MSLVKTIQPKRKQVTFPKELINIQEENQVIIKGYINQYCSTVRIFPNTYLKCNQTGRRYRLVNFYNIGEYPTYTELRRHQAFTLIFEGLDKNCESFDLIENLNEPRVFRQFNISRNNTGVYVLWF